MKVSAICSTSLRGQSYGTKKNNLNNPNFQKSNEKVSITHAFICSSILGIGAGALASFFISKKSPVRFYKMAMIGLTSTLASLGIILPKKI